MRIYDRIFKEMHFPQPVAELLFCPGLLRLREVRMANNQFVAFPAFASATRYEHSLGVCYLAGLCSSHLELDKSESIELMLACLYHDVGTPPFAHAMEEVLQSRYGFNHEKNLRELLIGNTGEFDFDSAQIYGGQMLRLQSACQRAKKKGLDVDIERIADIATGNPCNRLSALVCGEAIDLDNIDNIIRASTAMGIIEFHSSRAPELLAENLVKSFILEKDSIFYDDTYFIDILEWQRIRDIQYSKIFDSIDDFSYQTMIKQAIRLLFDNPESGYEVYPDVWRLTDSVFTNEYLLKHSKSRDIMTRVLRCDPFNCLGVLYVSGLDASKHLNSKLEEIEHEVVAFLLPHLNYSSKKLDTLPTSAVLANFYPDKRKRSISDYLLRRSDCKDQENNSSARSGALLGLFTPLGMNGYRTLEIAGEKKRNSVSYGREDLTRIIEILSSGCLKGYDIEIYGNERDGQKNKEATGFSQLGLF